MVTDALLQTRFVFLVFLRGARTEVFKGFVEIRRGRRGGRDRTPTSSWSIYNSERHPRPPTPCRIIATPRRIWSYQGGRWHSSHSSTWCWHLLERLRSIYAGD